MTSAQTTGFIEGFSIQQATKRMWKMRVVQGFSLLLLCWPGQAQVACSLRAGASRGACSQMSQTFGPALDPGTAREIDQLMHYFSVSPGFFACQETGGANAFATMDTLAPGTSGSVLLGVTLVGDEVQRSGLNNFTVPAILAHEVGHIVQFHHGNQLPTMLKELQADFLAGWYMGIRESGGGYPEALPRAMQAFYRLGDYDFTSPSHHGTPEQRLTAFKQGLLNLRRSLEDVYQISYRFVSTLSDSGTGSDDEAAPTAKRQTVESGGDLRQFLQQLIASARSGFVNLRGTPDRYSNGGAWIARAALPGAEECEVWKADAGVGPYYTCVIAKGSSREDVESSYAQFVEQVGTALGPEWSRRDPGGTRSRLVVTKFEKSGSDVDFEIYISSRRGVYRVEIDAQKDEN
jgi:hypothetical protein